MHRIVIKIGSSCIVNERLQSIFEDRMDSIAEDISWLRIDKKIEVILMSSGALAWGRLCMSMAGHDENCQDNQQLAGACGQVGIASAWAASIQKHEMLLGQLLLTPRDASSNTAISTIRTMLNQGVIPYINENIPTLEEYDNDNLAALVAHQLECDTLFLLSDVDGVYSANPKTDSNAVLINEINDVDSAISRFGGGSSSSLGTGGMMTKLLAAKCMSQIGVETIIGSGEQLNPIRAILSGSSGTVVKANRNSNA